MKVKSIYYDKESKKWTPTLTDINIIKHYIDSFRIIIPYYFRELIRWLKGY